MQTPTTRRSPKVAQLVESRVLQDPGLRFPSASGSNSSPQRPLPVGSAGGEGRARGQPPPGPRARVERGRSPAPGKGERPSARVRAGVSQPGLGSAWPVPLAASGPAETHAGVRPWGQRAGLQRCGQAGRGRVRGLRHF